MTTKTDHIKLPELPVAVPWHKGYDRESLESYARAAVEADRQGRMPSDDERGTSDPIAGLPRAQSVSDEMMDLVDRLGSEYDEVDPRAWGHLLVYAPKLSRYGQPAASAEPSQITDAMVDAYLKAQADVIRKVDDMWGNGGKAASYLHPVRESCRAGLQAALAAAPVAQKAAFYINPKVIDPSDGTIARGVDGALTWCREATRSHSMAVYAAPTPPEVEQAQPDTIPSFDELERRYFPEGRKKRLEWEAEQRALIWRGSTLDAQARPVVNQQMTIGVDQSFVNLTPETAAYTTAQPSAQGETVYRSADILKAFNNGFDLGLRQRTSQDRKNDETLADTQRQIIEAAERRGYARALAECGQDREDVLIRLLASDHKGMRVDYHGLLKQAQDALAHGIKETGLAEMLRQLEEHLTELGRRWYADDMAVVDEILQLYCIESDTRAAIYAARAAKGANHG